MSSPISTMEEHLRFLSKVDYPFWRRDGDVTIVKTEETPFPDGTDPPPFLFAQPPIYAEPIYSESEVYDEFSENGATRFLDLQAYQNEFHQEFIPSPGSTLALKSSKTTGRVSMDPHLLVKRLMHPAGFKLMFPSLVSSAEKLGSPAQFNPSASIPRTIEMSATNVHFTRSLVYYPEEKTWLVVDVPLGSSPNQVYPFRRSIMARAAVKEDSDVFFLESEIVWLEIFHRASWASSLEWFSALALA